MDTTYAAAGRSTFIGAAITVLLGSILARFQITMSSEEAAGLTGFFALAVHYFFPGVDNTPPTATP